jgi:hypothetical protein
MRGLRRQAMNLKRGQQAKDHTGVLDRQLRQLIMLGQRAVWRRIETSTDPHENTAPQKLLERFTGHTDEGKLAGADYSLCAKKVECWVCASRFHVDIL